MNKNDFIIILLKNNWSTGLCFFNEIKRFFKLFFKRFNFMFFFYFSIFFKFFLIKSFNFLMNKNDFYRKVQGLISKSTESAGT